MIGVLYAFVFSTFAQSLQFTQNKGQWDDRILFESDIFSGKLYLEKNGFTYCFLNGEDDAQFQQMAHDKVAPPDYFTMHYHAVRTRFVGARTGLVEGDFGYNFYRNYFLGRDKSKWASKVPVHQSIHYSELWDGIDLLVYGQQEGLKYDWLIKKGGNPDEIQVRYDGAENVFLEEGKLYVWTSVNHFVEQEPVAYQIIEGVRQDVACHFELNGQTISYMVGDYNSNYDLIIDPPILIFATYSGSSADNFGFTATYDIKGNLYAAGNVTDAYAIDTTGHYPATPGAFQVKPAGFVGASGPYGFFQCDMAISKYDSSGSNLLWASYLGGTDNDYPHSLVVDHFNRLVVLGSTYSTDFPMDSLSFDTTQNGFSDVVVAKFSEDGSALVGVTYVGGDRNDGVLSGSLIYQFADNFRGDIQISRNGDIYVATCSNSRDSLPLTSDALSRKPNGGFDGLLFELDSGLQKMKWCTLWGGKGDDALYSIRLDREQNLIVGGGTNSDSIFTTSKAFNRSYGGNTDGMVFRIDTKTKSVTSSCYIGTPEFDQVYFVDYDLHNHVYVFGSTEGVFPIIGNPYNFPKGGQFLMKLDENLDSILISTTLGARQQDPNISPTAFLVDNCYNIYFSGWGSNEGSGPGFHSGTTNGLPVTPDAMISQTDGNDFYLGVLDKDAQHLIYATYFGGSQTHDHVDGGTSRFNKEGVVYHSICGSCPDNYPTQKYISDIPTTANAVFPQNLSPRCSNASFKLDFNITYSVESDFLANPVNGCMPLTVNFTNRSLHGTDYLWVFGDGATDTSYNSTHTYTKGGKYQAYLKVKDSVSCNLVDSIIIEINVIDHTTPDFNFSVEPCGKEVTFSIPDNVDAPLGYYWDFGDGTTSNLKTPKHKFNDFGTHTIKLITNPGTPCRDSLVKQINLSDPGQGKLFIPNVFTPGDGDAFNPCYTFGGLRDCDELEVEIYNRYAEKVYETKELHFCWNGADKTSGRLLPAGVYYVIAKVRQNGGEWLEFKGTVTLIY